MKKYGYLTYLIFCLCLLTSLSTNAETENDKNTNVSIKIIPKTPALTLIFKKNSVIKDLYLINPKGESVPLAQKDDGLLATAKNEVIQIKKPLPGLWILSGPSSQIAHILILSHIDLSTNLTSGTYFNGEFISLTGYLEQDYQPITTDMAIQDMNMKLDLIDNNHQFSYVIPYNNKGIFNNSFSLQIPVGTYSAIWHLQDTFLSLEHQYTMFVQNNPFLLKNNPEHDALFVKLLEPDLINHESIKIKILNNNSPVNLPIIKHELTWMINFLSLCRQNGFTKDNVIIEISAQTASERDTLFKLLLNDEICSSHYTPLNMEQFKPKPKHKAALKPVKKAKHFFTMTRSLIVIVILFAIIAAISLGIWYRNKQNEIREEREEL